MNNSDKTDIHPELARWITWAGQLVGDNNPTLARQLAHTALQAVEAGASDALASVLAKLSFFPPGEADLHLLRQELAEVRRHLEQLTSYQNIGSHLTQKRLASQQARLEELLVTTLKRAAKAQPPPPAAPLRLTPLISAGILMLAAIGAFLLHLGVAAQLGVLCAALAMVIFLHRPSLAWLPAACLTLNVVYLHRSLNLPVGWIGPELVILAMLYLGVAQLLRSTGQVLRGLVAIQLMLCALLISPQPLLQSRALLASLLLVAWMSWQSRRLPWLLLAIPLAGTGLYWWLAR